MGAEAGPVLINASRSDSLLTDAKRVAIEALGAQERVTADLVRTLITVLSHDEQELAAIKERVAAEECLAAKRFGLSDQLVQHLRF